MDGKSSFAYSLNIILLNRATEWELLDVCINEGIGVIPLSPLRGWLSGKFEREMTEPPAESRISKAEKEGWGESWSNYNHEYTWNVLDELHAVSNKLKKHQLKLQSIGFFNDQVSQHQLLVHALLNS